MAHMLHRKKLIVRLNPIQDAIGELSCYVRMYSSYFAIKNINQRINGRLQCAREIELLSVIFKYLHNYNNSFLFLNCYIICFHQV